MDNRNTRCAYHLTEKSDWGAKSITVSNLPVYCRIHICYSLYPKKGQIGVAWAWNQEGTEKLVNGKQHFIWYVPSEWTDYLKTYTSIFCWNFPRVILPFTFHPEFLNFLSNGKYPCCLPNQQSLFCIFFAFFPNLVFCLNFAHLGMVWKTTFP